MTQAQLAERMGILPVSLKNIESGKSCAKLKRLFQIREILGCSMRDILLELSDERPCLPEVEKLQDVGRRIQMLRRGRDMSQTELAGKMGITASNLSSVESGRVDATLKNLLRLRKILGCSMRDFFEGPLKEDEPPEPRENECETEYQKVSRRVRELRTAMNMSMTELSKRSGVDLGNLSKIESGKSAPALIVLFKLRAVLGCSMRDFFLDGAEDEIRSVPPPELCGNIDLEYQRIGQRIRSISEAKKIPQQELARRMGMHLFCLRRIERGVQRPPLKRLFQLSEILGCPVTDLFEAPTREDFSAVEREFQKIGRRIRTIRDESDIGPREFASRLGVDLDTLAKIEDGRKETTLKNLYQIRGILGCAMRDFFEERTEKELRAEEVIRAMRIVKKIKSAEMNTP